MQFDIFDFERLLFRIYMTIYIYIYIYCQGLSTVPGNSSDATKLRIQKLIPTKLPKMWCESFDAISGAGPVAFESWRWPRLRQAKYLRTQLVCYDRPKKFFAPGPGSVNPPLFIYILKYSLVVCKKEKRDNFFYSLIFFWSGFLRPNLQFHPGRA